MPAKYSALLTMAFIVAIGMAAQLAEDSSVTSTGRPRGPAAMKKDVVLGSVESPLHRHTEKLQGPVDASVELIGERPEKPGDVFVLKGVISSSQALEHVDFKWSLPEGVELINGERSGQIVQLAASKPAEVTLTLKSLTGENHQVHLIASAEKGGTRFAQSTQYNTMLEPLIQTARKELEKSAKANAEAEQKTKLKIYH